MEKDNKPYAHAEKAYMSGQLFPYIRVGMQKVNLTPSVEIVNGEKVMTPNDPVYIYDTSGPFSDPDMQIDLKKGLPRMRESWITGRGDVEQLPSITSEYGRMRRDDKSLDHLALSISPCPTAPRRARLLPKWPTPRPASSPPKWSTSPSAKT